MTNYTVWTLTDPREDDPRDNLDVIIFNAALGYVQAIEYKEEKVFVISEEQFSKVEDFLNN